MEFLKGIAGKIIGGVVALLVIIAAISWFMMSPADRQEILSDTGRVLKWIGIAIGWLLIVGVVPWATFPVIRKAAEFDTNWAGTALVVVYTALEAVLLGWLYSWHVRGPAAWAFFAAATLVAGVYNLLACDWIAERVS